MRHARPRPGRQDTDSISAEFAVSSRGLAAFVPPVLSIGVAVAGVAVAVAGSDPRTIRIGVAIAAAAAAYASVMLVGRSREYEDELDALDEERRIEQAEHTAELARADAKFGEAAVELRTEREYLLHVQSELQHERRRVTRVEADLDQLKQEYATIVTWAQDEVTRVRTEWQEAYVQLAEERDLAETRAFSAEEKLAEVSSSVLSWLVWDDQQPWLGFAVTPPSREPYLVEWDAPVAVSSSNGVTEVRIAANRLYTSAKPLPVVAAMEDTAEIPVIDLTAYDETVQFSVKQLRDQA